MRLLAGTLIPELDFSPMTIDLMWEDFVKFLGTSFKWILSNMNPHFRSKDFYLRVYVEDTDFQGVVYHANYLNTFEELDLKFLIENNLSQTDAIVKRNESYVIKSINLSIIIPQN